MSYLLIKDGEEGRLLVEFHHNRKAPASNSWQCDRVRLLYFDDETTVLADSDVPGKTYCRSICLSADDVFVDLESDDRIREFECYDVRDIPQEESE